MPPASAGTKRTTATADGNRMILGLSFYHSIYRSIYLTIYLSIDRSNYRSIYVSIDLSIYLCVYFAIYRGVYLFLDRWLYLPVDLSIGISIYISLPLVRIGLPLYSTLLVLVFLRTRCLLAWSFRILFCICLLRFARGRYFSMVASFRFPFMLFMRVASFSLFR